MKLHSTVQDKAILSNVGEIGEFRIRNSAKAFNILSSGLYANKIRAIIRELSCNAADSHVAAGRGDTPFDVHLPNSLEPDFSIRDYGTGLSHEQVTNIYTTYFESTKTDSNAFIGALGLGSKSPFSYTDNFTVTAIKDGRKGIYTAFINEQGVPSIALMMEEATDEPAGVEVKFSVNDRYDFGKFRDEARFVYRYFDVKPKISGCSEFTFDLLDYESRDIVPGVHTRKGSGPSIAVMGNIAYPIDVPRGQANNGERDYFKMLDCGLEMHFAIGELDFQASREGLSYIPQTVEAIKAKLIALNDALTVVVKKEADAIDNLWERADFLVTKREHKLWQEAAVSYAQNTKLPTVNVSSGWNMRHTTFALKVDDLAKDYNIVVRGFTQVRHNSTLSPIKPSREYGDKDANGHYITWMVNNFQATPTTQFVINDTKVGATQRAKDHFRARKCPTYSRNIYVLEPADRSKPFKTDEFFAAIMNPPAENIHKASDLDKQERDVSVGRNVSILKLEKRSSGNYSYRRRDEDMVWRECSVKADSFDPNVTYYYVPLSGYQMESEKGYSSGKEFYDDVTSLPGLFKGEIYGVRKSDIKAIKLYKNWINLEEHITAVLNNRNSDSVLMGVVRGKLSSADVLNFSSNKEILQSIGSNSPYAKFISLFQGIDKFEKSMYNVERLLRNFAPNANVNPAALTVKYQSELDQLNSRYPLLSSLSTYRPRASDIAEYINLIDAKKGI